MEAFSVTVHFTDNLEIVMEDVMEEDFLVGGGPLESLTNPDDFLSAPPQVEPFSPPLPTPPDGILFGDFTEPWMSKSSKSPAEFLPPLSPPQAIDLEWVKSPVLSELGPSTTPFSSYKGFFAA
jgi:hypothetical protein